MVLHVLRDIRLVWDGPEVCCECLEVRGSPVPPGHAQLDQGAGLVSSCGPGAMLWYEEV